MHWLWYTLPLICVPGLERLLGGPGPPLADRLHTQRAVAVAAHPDDLEYFCGGTLCRLAREGAEVIAVLATRGERGGDPERRRAEQEAAGALLGYSRLYLLDFPDRGVRADDPRLQAALQEIFARERPDLLLTFDPVWPYPVYRHADHLAVAQAALSLWPGRRLLFHTRRPTLAVDITETFDIKVAAFAAHESQLPRRGRVRLIGFHLARRSRGQFRRYLEPFRSEPDTLEEGVEGPYGSADGRNDSPTPDHPPQ